MYIRPGWHNWSARETFIIEISRLRVRVPLRAYRFAFSFGLEDALSQLLSVMSTDKSQSRVDFIVDMSSTLFTIIW